VAIGSVHPWAYVPLWFACLGIGLLLAMRVGAVASLRRFIGRQRFAFHFSDRWLTLDADPSYGMAGWSFDLSQPALPRPALLVPALVFVGWVAVQLLPLPPAWRPLTLSTPDTLRGLAFLLSGLVLHMAAAAVFATREARERFRRALAALGALLAFVALFQLASGTRRIYGVFQSLEGGSGFGPFVNRNHFAGYMLMVVPLSLALLADAWRRYAHRAGERPNLRRRLVSLGAPEGVALLFASIPALATAGALIATTSRGALLAFAVSLGLAVLGLRRKREVPGWVLGVAFVTMALSWFGLERLEVRFIRTLDDAPGRTLVWKDTLERMDGLWLTGSGFNTFGIAMSHVTPWALPKGAAPWPEPIAEALASGSRVGVRVPEQVPGRSWYREAHNDYVQLLAETGVPGLVVGLWGALSVLDAARPHPWLLAALAAVLMHSFVEFDLQIPAIAVLFVVLAGMRPRAERA
jgi:O-antigen ligase